MDAYVPESKVALATIGAADGQVEATVGGPKGLETLADALLALSWSLCLDMVWTPRNGGQC